MNINLNSTQSIPAEGRLGTISGQIMPEKELPNGKTVGGIQKRVAKSGNPYVTFSVTFIERINGMSQAVRVGCSAWGILGEDVAMNLREGQMATVTGVMKTSEVNGKSYVNMNVINWQD